MWISPKASLSVSLLVHVNEPVCARYGWELATILRLYLNLQLHPPSTEEEGYCHINYVVHSPRLLFLLTPCSKHTLDCSFCDYISFCLFFCRRCLQRTEMVCSSPFCIFPSLLLSTLSLLAFLFSSSSFIHPFPHVLLVFFSSLLQTLLFSIFSHKHHLFCGCNPGSITSLYSFIHLSLPFISPFVSLISSFIHPSIYPFLSFLFIHSIDGSGGHQDAPPLWAHFLSFNSVFREDLPKQECIPVGCVPSAAVAVSRGVYLVRGVSALGGVPGRGVYLAWGGGICSGGVPAGGCTWSQGGVPGPAGICSRGVPGPGGVCSLGDVCSGVCTWPRGVPHPGGVCSSGECTWSGTPPPCGQTDACKNITFATSLRAVIIGWHSQL